MVYGIGMNGGYPSQANFQQLSQRYGHSNRAGSVLQGLTERYGCCDCFTPGPYYANYPVAIHNAPNRNINPPKRNWFLRLFMGES